MENSVVVFTFAVLDQKYPFRKFGPKTQNCQFKLIFAEFSGDIQYFCFWPKLPFLDQFGFKKSKLSLSTEIQYLQSRTKYLEQNREIQ